MATRILIINKQLVFAVTIKQALEQTGVYEVHPFTAADAAIEYLQEHPQDIALVDFTLSGTTGPLLVERLRGVQPDLLLIASPRPAEATEVMRALRLQGMINLPFTVREIVPLIEQALDNRQQDEGLFSDVTTYPVRSPEYPTTKILNEDPESPAQIYNVQDASQYFGKTRTLDEDTSDAPPTPSKTKILDDMPPAEEVNIQTHIFNDDQPAPVEKFYGQTRILDDDNQPVTEDWQTHIFEDNQAELGGETPQFRRPSGAPEISNLDSVLANLADSSLFEPPLKDEDTPSVPTKDSDALRQFLATAGEFAKDTSFDDILQAVDSEKVDAEEQRKPSDFDSLVDSMRSSEPHSTLPDRQDQFMDFILTSGMDAVLQEIEKVKTGTLRQ
jgi:CheY-like chemotaxis protein